MTPTDKWHLDTHRLGRRVLVFNSLDSTNAFALSLADNPKNNGLVILADEQTAGRGQHGRQWSCPRGGGVLMSVLLFPPLELRRPAILTAWAAVSVCELILKLTKLETQIKWPNDVLVRGRKVCGILLEQRHGTVAGIGLNVNQPAEHFAEMGLGNAASLAMLTGANWDCHSIARQLILQLDADYDELCRGQRDTLELNWQRRIGLIDKQVEVVTAGACYRGLLEGMTVDGLRMQLIDGTVARLAPESVKSVAAV